MNQQIITVFRFQGFLRFRIVYLLYFMVMILVLISNIVLSSTLGYIYVTFKSTLFYFTD